MRDIVELRVDGGCLTVKIRLNKPVTDLASAEALAITKGIRMVIEEGVKLTLEEEFYSLSHEVEKLMSRLDAVEKALEAQP